MKIILILVSALALSACATRGDLKDAIGTDAANYDKYLAAMMATNDASFVDLECDSPCKLRMPGVPSATPERPTPSAPSVASVLNTQVQAGASLGGTLGVGYLGLKESRDRHATQRYIAEQNRLQSESEQQTIQQALTSQSEQITTLLDRLVPEEPVEPEPDPDPDPDPEPEPEPEL